MNILVLNNSHCTPASPSLSCASQINNSGLAYLEAKGKEEGVVTLPSGLLYKEIRPGNGEFCFFSPYMLMSSAASLYPNI